MTVEEAAQYHPAQLEFLERKRRAAAGLGPVLPGECTCQACQGSGRLSSSMFRRLEAKNY